MPAFLPKFTIILGNFAVCLQPVFRYCLRLDPRSRVLRALQATGERIIPVVLSKAQHQEAVLSGETARRHSGPPRCPMLEQHLADHSAQEHGGILSSLRQPDLHGRGMIVYRVIIFQKCFT